MPMNPDFSPWGKIDWMETLAPGFDMVATPSHGGIMVSREASFMLSPAARKCGAWNGGYLCFEEDTAENVVLRELLDQKLWQVPDRIKDPAAFEARIDQIIQQHHPDYWKSREIRLAKNEKAIQRQRPSPVR